MLLVLLGVIIIYYSTKFLGDTMKLVTKLFLVIIVIMSLLTVLVFKDIQELKEEVANSESRFILHEGNRTYAAVGIRPVEDETYTEDSFVYYSGEEIAKMEQDINQNDTVFTESGKAFIFRPRLLNKSYTLDFGVALDENDLLAIVMSDDPYITMAERMNAGLNLSERSLNQLKTDLERNYGEAAKIKGYLFAALVINYFQPEGMKLATDIKNQDLKVRPETISFKVIRYVPMIGLE